MNKWIYTVQFAIVAACVGLGTLASANIDDTLFVLGEKKLSSGEITVGYATFPSDDNNTQAVLPYSEQESFPVLDLESFWARESSRLRLDSLVNSRNDYIAEFFYDYTGRLRLSLLDESLIHRLDHQPLPPSTAQILTTDNDPGADYESAVSSAGCRVEVLTAISGLPCDSSLSPHKKRRGLSVTLSQ